MLSTLQICGLPFSSSDISLSLTLNAYFCYLMFIRFTNTTYFWLVAHYKITLGNYIPYNYWEIFEDNFFAVLQISLQPQKFSY